VFPSGLPGGPIVLEGFVGNLLRSEPGSAQEVIWWESKMQVDLVQKGKVISSWDKFTKAIRK
jgi:hypothetical protein